MQNNVKVFMDDKNFISLDTSGAVNNVITIGGLKLGIPSNGTENNPVYCSFRGVPLKQITEDKLDESSSEDAFCYITSEHANVIKLAVNKTDVDTREAAKKYIRGLLVDYQIAPISPAGTSKEPLYEVETYLSDGSLVSPTTACGLSDIAKKISAFETNFDVNSAGWYNHIIRRVYVTKQV